MKNVLVRFSTVCLAVFFVVAVCGKLSAQAAPETPPANPASPQDLSQAELLKAYLQLREQLHATQLAIANNRVEAETAARAQAAALAEKVESIKAAIEAERVRQQGERERQQLERERQQMESERLQAETQRSNRIVLWIAVAFGGVGLLAMLLLPLFHLRAINRMTEIAAPRPQLAAPATHPLLGPEAAVPSDQVVTTANQRLMSVIDRMERRIGELEHTASVPLQLPATKSATLDPAPASRPPTSPIKVVTEADALRRAAATNGQETWIAVLMNKARTLLAANKTIEALACYDEILSLDTRHSEAWVKRGAALERLDQLEEAIECYERGIAADGKMTLAYLRKGAACKRLGRHGEAVECFEQALQVEETGLKSAVHV